MSNKAPVVLNRAAAQTPTKVAANSVPVLAVAQIAGAVRDCYVTHSQEKTRRAEIEADSKAELARISERGSVAKRYLDRRFDERTQAHEVLLEVCQESQDFERFDRALSAIERSLERCPLEEVQRLQRSTPRDEGDS